MNRTFKKNFKVTLTTVFLILAFIGCQVFQTMASASGEITVTANNLSELLSAIDAAQDGDVIGFRYGINIYVDTVIGDINKHITLKRVDELSYLNIPDTVTCTFQNVTLDGGGMKSQYPLVRTYSSANFQNVTFQNSNTSVAGGAISVYQGTASFQNCTFDNNTAVVGGHIFVNASATAIIESSIFKNGHAGNGGAIRNSSSTSTCNITSSVITGNTADDFGGGLANNGSMTISQTKVYDNSAVNGGADIGNMTYGNLNLTDSIETLKELFKEDKINPKGWVCDYDFEAGIYIPDVDPTLPNSLLKLDYDIIVDPTPSPTMTPTPEPTAEPTTEPTTTPTVEPTAEPSPIPTFEPTPTEIPIIPTLEPTIEPTPMEVPATPTTEPTVEPTISPTPIPTEIPTYTPTPTEQPSTPTINPTATPVPTSVPIVPPITIPSSGSSTNPVATPTVTPTVKPSATPTIKPTTAPSKSPTPTNKPTVTPKPSPTSKPSAISTKKPTSTPTVIKYDSQGSDALYGSASSSNSLGYKSGSAVNDVASEPTEKPVSEEGETVPEPTISAVTEQGSINSLDKNVKIISNGADCVFEINDEGYTITINADADKSAVPTVGSNIVNDDKSGSYDWIEIVKIALLLGIFLCLLKNSGLVRKIKDKNE